MSIALFIIFLFMNFFILLIMKFVYTSNYSYTEECSWAFTFQRNTVKTKPS